MEQDFYSAVVEAGVFGGLVAFVTVLPLLLLRQRLPVSLDIRHADLNAVALDWAFMQSADDFANRNGFIKAMDCLVIFLGSRTCSRIYLHPDGTTMAAVQLVPPRGKPITYFDFVTHGDKADVWTYNLRNCPLLKTRPGLIEWHRPLITRPEELLEIHQRLCDRHGIAPSSPPSIDAHLDWIRMNYKSTVDYQIGQGLMRLTSDGKHARLRLGRAISGAVEIIKYIPVYYKAGKSRQM